MDFISRKEAKERGLKRYFTGKPCKRGHVAERKINCSTCVECHKEQGRRYLNENRDKERERLRVYREENRERVRESQRKFDAKNKERENERKRKWKSDNRGYVLQSSREYSRRYRTENRDKALESQRRHYYANHESALERRRRYTRENRDKVLDYASRYYKQNPGAVLANQARRRAFKKSQTCECCANDSFAAIYAQAREQGCEVDHIKPLALGGMHCVRNLQLLTPEDHKAKTRADLRRIADAKREAKAATCQVQ